MFPDLAHAKVSQVNSILPQHLEQIICHDMYHSVIILKFLFLPLPQDNLVYKSVFYLFQLFPEFHRVPGPK